MPRILLTSGRGTFALALARTFHAAGHTVFVADAWPRVLCSYSTAVERTFQVPSPSEATDDWVEAIARIFDEQAIDLIIPVCEEVLYLAQANASLPNRLPLFAPDFETLLCLHNKWLFNQKAADLGLSVPATEVLSSRDDLTRVYSEGNAGNTVFKPVYSRFATQTVVRPKSLESLRKIEPTPQRPWLAQEFLPGRPFATFSIAHRGRLTAHATYAADFCMNFGPTCVYRRADREAILDWVRSFVQATEYTGQIGLDFIEDSDGNIAAIECNPRLTGGMYLLKDDPRFPAAYLDPQTGPIEATSERSYAFRMGLLIALSHHTDSFPGYKEWCRHFLFARSANQFVWSDPWPRLMGPILTAAFIGRCFRERQDGRLLATRDIEWSEERTASPTSGRYAAVQHQAG
jgi:hypothetical protein